jgi:hypothetical protein
MLKGKEMNKFIFLIFIASVFIASSCAPPAADLSKGEWIDLGHDFGDDTIYWVNAEPFKRTGTGAMTDKGLLLRVRELFGCGTWRHAH